MSVVDLKYFLCQGLVATFFHGEIEDVKWDATGYDIDRHANVAYVGDAIGGLQDKGVVDFVGLHLHVLDASAVNVLLGKCLDRRLLASDVTLVCFHKMSEKAMIGTRLDCERDLRWHIVFMCDLCVSRKHCLILDKDKHKDQEKTKQVKPANISHTNLKFSFVNLDCFSFLNQEIVAMLHNGRPLMTFQVNFNIDPCCKVDVLRRDCQVEMVHQMSAVIVLIRDESVLEVRQCE